MKVNRYSHIDQREPPRLTTCFSYISDQSPRLFCLESAPVILHTEKAEKVKTKEGIVIDVEDAIDEGEETNVSPKYEGGNDGEGGDDAGDDRGGDDRGSGDGGGDGVLKVVHGNLRLVFDEANGIKGEITCCFSFRWSKWW